MNDIATPAKTSRGSAVGEGTCVTIRLLPQRVLDPTPAA